jgi:hypothetical protein
MKRSAASIPTELAQELLKRWQAGERLPALARVASEVVKRALAPDTVRGWLIHLLGGQASYDAAAAQREQEHPRAKPQPPRVPRIPGEARPVIDDSNVQVITAGKIKDGWRGEKLLVRGVQEDVLIAPDGTRYLRAKDSERADLIYESPTPGLPKYRLRKEETSSKTKVVRREQRLIRRGEKARTKKFQAAVGDLTAVPADALPHGLPADVLDRATTKHVRRKK